jgi:hypothetical protein
LVPGDDIDNINPDDSWEDNDDDNEDILPEAIQLLLPSSFTGSQRRRLQIETFSIQEAQLREGQANDALEGVRNSLAQVSLTFRTKVRNAQSVYTRTRSWDDVQRCNAQVRLHVTRYRTARHALIQLGASTDICQKYLEIKAEHLKMPGDIVEANRIGQRSDSLAWFWRLDANKSGKQDSWMKECVLYPLIIFQILF